MRRAACILCLAATALAVPAAATPSATPGKAVAYAMPVLAGSLAVYKKDWKGLAQLTVVTGLTFATAYGLKQIVRERRPYQSRFDHSATWDAFPSTTSAIASAPSSFVWSRYGWEWGLPMFVISKYPSYALQKSKQNRIWDGLASTGIAWGLNEIFTTRFHPPGEKRGLDVGVDSDGNGGMHANIVYRW